MISIQNPPRFFFSYARIDSDFVLDLTKHLRGVGVPVWLDQLDIAGGQRWDRAIEEALESCFGMIVGLSPESVRSINVMDEVSYGLEEQKLVVPIVIRPCVIPFRLRRVHRVDFGNDYETAFKQLTRALAIDPASADSPKRRTTIDVARRPGDAGGEAVAFGSDEEASMRDEQSSHLPEKVVPATRESWNASVVSLDERFSLAGREESLRLVNHICEILQHKKWPDKRIGIVEFAIRELLENAFSHGIAGLEDGAVRLNASITRDWCDVRISDSGPGVDLSNQLQMQTACADESGLRGLAYVSRLGILSQEGSKDLELWIDRDPLSRDLFKYRGISIVQITGRIDHQSAAEMERKLDTATHLGTQIAVDLSTVEYISSAGLRVLMLFARKLRSQSGRIALIVRPNGVIAEIMHISRFDRAIPNVATRDEAVAFFRGSPK